MANRSFEEQYRDKLNIELRAAKDEMESIREEYGNILINEQQIQAAKSQSEFQQQQQEGRIQQLKEMLNPKLKKRPKEPIVPKKPEPKKEKPDAKDSTKEK